MHYNTCLQKTACKTGKLNNKDYVTIIKETTSVYDNHTLGCHSGIMEIKT